MPIEALQALAEESRQLPRAWHQLLGTALRRQTTSTGPRRRARRRTGADGNRRRESAPANRPDCHRNARDLPRAIASLEAVMTHDFDNVDGPRARQVDEGGEGHADPARLQPATSGLRRLIRSMREAHAALGRLADAARRLGHRGPRVPAVCALKPVDQAGAYTDLAESYLKSRQARRGAQAGARRARDRAQLPTRAGLAAGDRGGEVKQESA